MVYRVLADSVVILHLLFIVFALLGGLMVLWRSYWVFIHLPAAIWSALVSFKGWVCPLTPLEVYLRKRAGSEGYSEGFVEHYLIPLIYPNGLSFNVQVILGITAVVINLAIYSIVYYWRRGRK
ncbi:DUF2784 domain-containing protein [Photobacterium sp. SDRW27]|uniref:DUF2784 domain-containing protein n=1 Tax=Photobacterium obscurum TaxID=2829490 RepID=UPI002243EC56|nr:DUF2784 domain-containing protein [Photobacterium obscurum]MCW8329198.1 DUF2784 domain-containing protein [Photobacterium obscurum]